MIESRHPDILHQLSGEWEYIFYFTFSNIGIRILK